MHETIPPNPDDLIRRAIEAGRNIKFGRGVVGKTSHAVLALLGLWATIVLRISANLIADAVLVAVGTFITAFVWWYIKSTQRFATENPAQAILEGTELIEYKRYEAEAKGGLISIGPMESEESSERLIERKVR